MSDVNTATLHAEHYLTATLTFENATIDWDWLAIGHDKLKLELDVQLSVSPAGASGKVYITDQKVEQTPEITLEIINWLTCSDYTSERKPTVEYNFSSYPTKSSAVRTAHASLRPLTPVEFKELLNCKLPLDDFRTRTRITLKNNNIFYVADLLTMTDAKLLRTPNFGRKSLNEVNDWLASRHLHLGMDIGDWKPPNN